MDLRSARAARGDGRYDAALELWDVDHPQPGDVAAQVCRWLLELTVSRRVIDDLMGELALADCPYEGFSQLNPGALERADAAGLDRAFAGLAKTGGMGAAAVAMIAEELGDRRSSADELGRQLEDLGCSMTAGICFILARVCAREGRVDAAIDHLNAGITEAPALLAARRLLARMLLAKGQISAALIHGYFATQLRRHPVGSVDEEREGFLRYLGHEIFFIDGVFYSVPPTDRRVNVTYRKGSFVELYNPIPYKWRRVYRGIARHVLPTFVLRWLQRVIFRTAAAPVGFKSDDLFDLITTIRRGSPGGQKPVS